MAIIRTILFSLCLLVPVTASLSTAAFAQQQPAMSQPETQFRAWLKSLEGDGMQAKFARIDYERSSDTLSVHDLVVIVLADNAQTAAQAAPLKPSLRSEWTFQKVVFTGLSIDDSGVAYTSAVAQNIAIAPTDTSADQTLRMERIEFAGSFIPRLAAFKPDPSRPISSQAGFLRLVSRTRLDKVTASKMTVGADFSIGQIALDGIAGGKIAAIGIDDLQTRSAPTANAATAPSGRNTLSIKSAALRNFNFDPYIRLFEESAYLSGGSARPWNNIFEEMVVRDVKIDNGTASLAISSATINRLKLRQFSQNLTDMLDKSATDPSYLLQNPDIAARLTTAIRSAFALESASASDIVFAAPNEKGMVTAGLKAVSLSNLTATHLDRLDLNSARISDASGTGNLRNLSLADINIAPSGPNASTAPDAPLATGEAMLPTVGSVVAEGFDIDSVKAKLSFEKLDVAMSYFIGPAPTNVKAKLDNLKLAVSTIGAPAIQQALSELGYENLDLSFRFSSAWQDAENALAIDTIELTAKDMGTLSLSGLLTGIKRSSYENSVETFIADVMNGGLRNFRLSYENHSLMQRFIDMLAKQNQQPAAELRKFLSANMPAIMGKIPSPDIRNKFIFSAISFINDPKVLQLTSKTSDIIPMENIRNAFAKPETLPVVLNLDASANARR